MLHRTGGSGEVSSSYISIMASSLNDLKHLVKNGYVQGWTFNERQVFQIDEIKNCVFDNCKFINGFTLRTTLGFRITFQNCELYDFIAIANQSNDDFIKVENSNKVGLIETESKGYFKIESSNIKEINCPSMRFEVLEKSRIDTIRISGYLKAQNSSFGNIICKKGGMRSEGCEFDYLQLESGRESWYIEGGKIDTLAFKNRMEINNRTILRNVKFIKCMKVYRSDMQNVKLERCFLGDCRFEVSKSDLRPLEFDGVIWKNKPFVRILNCGIDEPSSLSSDDYIEARDFYRHLKISSINNHDKVNELKFYAFEMSAYNSSISWYTSPVDKFSLWVSKITNYYGLNWFWPILWYIGISGIVYCLMFLKDNGVHDQGFFMMFYETDFGRMLNPTHGFDKFELIKPENSARIMLDFVVRIIQGTLVYQTISAFRKFFK